MDSSSQDKSQELPDNSFRLASLPPTSPDRFDDYVQSLEAMQGSPGGAGKPEQHGFLSDQELLDGVHGQGDGPTRDNADEQYDGSGHALNFEIKIQLVPPGSSTTDRTSPEIKDSDDQPASSLGKALQKAGEGFAASFLSIADKIEALGEKEQEDLKSLRQEEKTQPGSLAQRAARALGSVAGRITGGYMEGCADSMVVADKLGLLSEKASQDSQKMQERMKENPLASLPEIAGYEIGAVTGTVGTVLLGASQLAAKIDARLRPERKQ